MQTRAGQEDVPPEYIPWTIYISPDTPQPYIEVLKQYEQFMNADNQDINDESVQNKLENGEWKYLYVELCAILPSKTERGTSENLRDTFCYALTDLTGDGFPEMIMAYGDTPYVIYNYSETNGIGMEHATSYFYMTIYKNGIVRYVSGGAYSTTTYLQFHDDTKDWVVIDRIAVEGTWDAANGKMNDTAYYKETRKGNEFLQEPISEEEYLRIENKYVTEPMEFEWIPLIYNRDNIWHSYEENDDFIYDHDFMASRDGQGYHWICCAILTWQNMWFCTHNMKMETGPQASMKYLTPHRWIGTILTSMKAIQPHPSKILLKISVKHPFPAPLTYHFTITDKRWHITDHGGFGSYLGTARFLIILWNRKMVYFGFAWILGSIVIHMLLLNNSSAPQVFYDNP